MSADIELSATDLANMTNRAVVKLSSQSGIVGAFDELLATISEIQPIKKGYLVEFTRSARQYRLLRFLLQTEWDKDITSSELFYGFLGQGHWNYPREQGLYERVFSREIPHSPYVIPDWMDAQYGVHETLRVTAAGVSSAIVVPFVGQWPKSYLAMIMFDSKPVDYRLQCMLSLSMAYLTLMFFSRENGNSSFDSPLQQLARQVNMILSPKSLGWDTLVHSRNVAAICDILAEYLGFGREERLMMSIVARCHDWGKVDVQTNDKKIAKLHMQRAKGKKDFTPTEEQAESDDIVFARHPQLGAQRLWNMMSPPQEIKLREWRPWVVPVLCHHVGATTLEWTRMLDQDLVGSLTAALGFAGTTTDEVATAFQASYGTSIVGMALDCLRCADLIEDKAGSKAQRPVPDMTPRQAVEHALKHAKDNRFLIDVCTALRSCKSDIVDYYEEIGKV